MERELMRLGFNLNSVGFRYWLYGIEIYKNNYRRYGFTLEFVYNEIASFFNTTRDRVERAMRTSSIKARINIKAIYGYNGKVTTKTLFEILSRTFIIDNHIPRID